MILLPDLNQSPFVLLGQIKTKAEKKLGKSIPSYSMAVDCIKKEIQFTLEGYPTETKKDAMAVFVMEKSIKMVLGKKTPEFNRCTIFYKDDFIQIALVLKDGSIQTKSVSKDEEGSTTKLLKDKFS